MSLLKEPITINRVEIANRLVMPPMATAKSADDGAVTDALLAYYDEKSKGGYIGLIIVEHAYIDMAGKASAGQLSIASDEAIPGLKKLVDVIHGNGSKVVAQINHAGSAAQTAVTGSVPVSASAVAHPRGKGDMPRALETAELPGIVDLYVQAARRAKAAGFDGVELHAAHGYLLNQFYSPLTNKRDDAYTGSTLEGRTRLLLEVYRAVRAEVGEDYLVALRLGACDYREGGSTKEDSAEAARLFAAAGLDLLDISGGHCGYVVPGRTEEGYFAELTEAIKAVTDIPVILAGGVLTGAGAEALLQKKSADMIGVARAILKDSDWAKNVMA